ncbi:MAG: asparagine synthase (glutamine-hydrolyzing) [Gammaproteobacteria bacterium]|nr:asparagine synthase (glutamine-hydrolyzing) [Gammaproteobacteria bacterium]
MCGILSIFSLGNREIDENLLRNGLTTLHHRGPDNTNHWISPTKDVALGHTRLSIIDLNTGEQPISNQDESVRLVVNGEFYDFEDIREDLREKGYHFKTQSDSEIALHLYNEHGTGCLKYLRGEFAFNIWDSRNQLFIAARDRLGIKPLFYTVYENKLYFASEMKALFAAGVPAQWDEESYLSRAFFFRDRTLFKNIHQVPPGHYIIATRSGFRIKKYWDFDYPEYSNANDKVNENEVILSIRESLQGAVKTRLRADVPVAVYLSGGIDSGAVLGMASEFHSQPVDAFTLSFTDKDYDESLVAERAANAFGAKYNTVNVSSDDLADNFEKSIWHTESICFNSHSVAKFILSDAVSKQGFKVVLTGEGADEVFGGYSAFRQDMILHNAQGQDENYIAAYLGQLKQNNAKTSGLLTPVGRPDNIEFMKKLLGFEPTFLLPLAESIDTLKTIYNAQTLSAMGGLHPIHQFLSHTEQLSKLNAIEPVHASMYLLSKSALCNYVLVNLGDRMEMAHSLEGRTPFLDHHLIEKVMKLPVNYKIRGQTEKYILREAAKPYLIDEVYKREKQPFLAPPSTKQKNLKLHALVQDTLRGDAGSALPFIDNRKLIKYLDGLPQLSSDKQVANESLLMELTSLCFLQKHYM